MTTYEKYRAYIMALVNPQMPPPIQDASASGTTDAASDRKVTVKRITNKGAPKLTGTGDTP